MSSESNELTLDIEALLVPIDPDRPCGKSKETDQDTQLINDFQTLSVDFSEARDIEKARRELELLTLEQQRDYLQNNSLPKQTPKWQNVIDISIKILTQHSKDTRVVINLMEAMCWVHGFPGLRDALELSNKLIEKYDESLLPSGDQFYRYKFFNNLNSANAFEAAVTRISLVRNIPFHLAGYGVAKHIESMSLDEQTAQREAGKLTLEDFATKLQKQSGEEIKAYGLGIEQALLAAQNLDGKLRKLTGNLNYGIGKVVAKLVEFRDWYTSLTAELPSVESALEPQATVVTEGTGTAIPAPSRTVDHLRSREEALNSLLKVAKFFRTTEPHSPLSYALEQAVRWGKMELPDLLQDLVQNDEVLTEVYRRMGIQKKQENNDSN